MAEFYAGQEVTVPITVASAPEKTPIVRVNGLTLRGVYVPAAWTATATMLRFNASADGVNTYPVCTPAGAPAQVTLTTPGTAASFVTVDSLIKIAQKYIQVVSHNGTTTIAQAADRELILSVVP